MSIGNALSNALSGMSAASRRAEIVSHNIANATTEGYARQRIDTSQRVTAGRGAGVDIEAPVRMVDPRLTADRRGADAMAGSDTAQAEAGRALADAIGGPDDPGSLFSRIADLENGFRLLAETPESTALQERAANAAASVVTGFHDASKAIERVRTDADRNIDYAVKDINATLEEIQSLNKHIAAESNSGRGAAAFEQQRDDAIDRISEYVPIRTVSRGQGQIAIFTDQGATLLDGSARQLEFSTATVVTAGLDRRSGVGTLSGLTVDGIDLTPGSSPQSLESGKLAGLFEARDGASVQAITELDSLAADLVARFEAPGLADASGRGLFTDAGASLAAAPAPGLAGRLAVSDRVDPDAGGAVWRLRDGLDAATQGPAGSSIYARALLNAMTEPRNPGGPFSKPDSAAGLAADLGTVFERRGQALEDVAAVSQSQRVTLREAETAVSGVDVDQELQKLILIEQAYAANARVIEVSDRLIQRLLEI